MKAWQEAQVGGSLFFSWEKAAFYSNCPVPALNSGLFPDAVGVRVGQCARFLTNSSLYDNWRLWMQKKALALYSWGPEKTDVFQFLLLYKKQKHLGEYPKITVTCVTIVVDFISLNEPQQPVVFFRWVANFKAATAMRTCCRRWKKHIHWKCFNLGKNICGCTGALWN